MPFSRALEEGNAIYTLNAELIQLSYPFHHIIRNKDGQMITFVQEVPYILLQIVLKENRKIELTDLITPIHFMMQHQKLQTIIRSDWIHLWTKKIDYFEYQIQHLQKKYLPLTDSLAYFIGLGENAISYVQNTLLEMPRDKSDGLVVAHRRINVTDDLYEFYNPLSLVLDHQARDIAEYLKSLFYYDCYTIEELQQYFQRIQLSSFGYRLLYGRLLFPSFYFDLYDKMINGYENQEQLNTIIKRIPEYERFLYDIYRILKNYTNLPPVAWLIKKFSL